MSETDSLHRFVFERSRVRGELVRLDAAWQAVLERHTYPAAVKQPLGEALVSVLLLTATLKLEGSLILQAQGEGPIRTLVAQATHEGTVRGLARWEGEIEAGDLQALFGKGQLVLTINAKNRDRYQGIVPLEGAGIGAALEGYFASSEQLPSRFWLAVSDKRAAGLMLQRLPGPTDDEDDWNRTVMLADTVQPRELLQQSTPDLLRRLFHEESLRLFEPEPVAFRCGCSRTRVADNLRALGRDEVDDIIAQQGLIEVTCEFCNRGYRFDAVDARSLFTGVVNATTPPAQH
ncbi:MAG: Hsp33 family molecular chaperone HslO [Chromatiaceae bacterium]|uniref:Hsp33 family molecular chaperone HslO n=1 Tax=Lamprobacter modestohalophilus TaxID=1064514 RepID=UPI001902EBC6|nr:Hsp33 family molecular chaperone HslO [Lamprobacter modestohalophilus]MCF7976516.1 Hsp33 family molecular chaperone HslO [Chromatiaceae bacterium]MCF7994832.1 Hsp33 family molecular chaperone HslO [Chromatiaceae bacterium]